MQTFLDACWLWIVAHLPVFIAILPTLTVALTKVGWLPPWLSKLLQVFSILAHADVGWKVQPKWLLCVHDAPGKSKSRMIFRKAKKVEETKTETKPAA